MTNRITIIGGGPAGASAAIRLARTGRRVILYEKKRFPRPKLCGGFLSPEALEDLAELDVLDSLRRAGAVTIRRTVIASRQGIVAEATLPGDALCVTRDILDDLLLRQASAHGVDIRYGVDGFQQDDASDYRVLATGRQFLGLKRFPWYASPATEYFGLQASYKNVADLSDQVELDLVDNGYVGLARQNGGTVNICALTTQEAMRRHGPSLDHVMAHFMEENVVLRDHLQRATRVSDWMATGPVRLGIRRLVDHRTFYVGDAACVVDPFAGEGMAIALYSSRILSRAFLQNRAAPEQEYARLWKKVFLPSLRWNAVLRMFYSVPILREPSIRLLESFPLGMNWLTALSRYRRLEAV